MAQHKAFNGDKNQKKLQANIFGSTVINHSIRIKLRITNNEYVVMGFLDYWFQYRQTSPTQHNLFNFTGIRPVVIGYIIQRLKIKKLIERDITPDGMDYTLIPTERWYKCFESRKSFEKFWITVRDGGYLNMGIKSKAKNAYFRLYKRYHEDDIMKMFIDYIDYCDNMGIRKTTVSKWIKDLL